ncbi:MAG: GTP 3',8-cyclase MoaA [Chloroflexi bacterium]|nr:GTP 3',8-cyclase MoaA [Chloroflexota bacterium]
MTPETRPTVLDTFGRPLRDLRISVTDRCNFRCPYCMPAEIYGARYKFLPREQLLTFEEITRLARIFVSLGVVKLRLTGGEPTIRAQLPTLVRMLSEIQGAEDLTLTTNGYLLARMAGELRAAGLQRITVSLDSLDQDVFKEMNGRGFGPERVLEGIAAAESVGLSPIKINCVVQRGINDHTLVDLARRFKGTGNIVRFIEFMDVGTLNRWDMKQVVSADEIVARIGATFPLEQIPPAYRGETALKYRYRDGAGEIGVIASVTKPFCGDCTRARLTTDGKLVTCLFAAGGKDLKGLLRTGASDEDIRGTILGIWSKRQDRYSEERAGLMLTGPAVRHRRKIEMYQIGG